MISMECKYAANPPRAKIPKEMVLSYFQAPLITLQIAISGKFGRTIFERAEFN